MCYVLLLFTRIFFIFLFSHVARDQLCLHVILWDFFLYFFYHLLFLFAHLSVFFFLRFPSCFLCFSQQLFYFWCFILRRAKQVCDVMKLLCQRGWERVTWNNKELVIITYSGFSFSTQIWHFCSKLTLRVLKSKKKSCLQWDLNSQQQSSLD